MVFGLLLCFVCWMGYGVYLARSGRFSTTGARWKGPLWLIGSLVPLVVVGFALKSELPGVLKWAILLLGGLGFVHGQGVGALSLISAVLMEVPNQTAETSKD